MGQCAESFRVHASLACIAELLKKNQQQEEATKKQNGKPKT